MKFVDIDSTEEVVRLFEVELQKPRNLSTHESEECEYGEVVGLLVLLRVVCILYSQKVRTWCVFFTHTR